MNRKIALLSIFFWIKGGLLILGALFILLIGVLGGAGLLEPNQSMTDRLHGVLGTFVIATWFGGLAAAHVVIGFGLRHLHPWARVAGIVIGIINIINCCAFPVGTALGVFTLIVLFSEDAARAFDRRAA